MSRSEQQKIVAQTGLVLLIIGIIAIISWAAMAGGLITAIGAVAAIFTILGVILLATSSI